MEYRILGRTGLRVSASHSAARASSTKRRKRCAPISTSPSDTASTSSTSTRRTPNCGRTSGAALEGRRGDFVIQGHLCTTWENGQYLRTRDPEKTLASFDLQLQQLRTDCLDIGMIHYVDAEADFHRVFGGEIIRIAQRLREEGRIRHIGISSHNPAVARMAVETGLVDVLMFSVNPCYDLQPAGRRRRGPVGRGELRRRAAHTTPTATALRTVRKDGVGIDAMKVYGGGDR